MQAEQSSPDIYDKVINNTKKKNEMIPGYKLL